MPNFAVASATRRSHDAAISSPAPRQYPDMRATTGTGAWRIAAHTWWIEVMKGARRLGRKVDHGADVRATDERPLASAA